LPGALYQQPSDHVVGYKGDNLSVTNHLDEVATLFADDLYDNVAGEVLNATNESQHGSEGTSIGCAFVGFISKNDDAFCFICGNLNSLSGREEKQ
jgi:hypothetical protein